MKLLKGNFLPFMFCLDFSDPAEPKYFGYHDSKLEFSLPYFTEDVAQILINEFTRMNHEYDNNSDILYWRHKNILWIDGTDTTIKNLINPVWIIPENEPDGPPQTVYGIGHGAWLWERAELTEIKEKLARAYSAIISKWLTPKELKKANKLNRTTQYINNKWDAVHSYCDGNQALLDAFETTIGRSFDFQCQADFDISNAAQQMAIDRNHFTI